MQDALWSELHALSGSVFVWALLCAFLALNIRGRVPIASGIESMNDAVLAVLELYRNQEQIAGGDDEFTAIPDVQL